MKCLCCCVCDAKWNVGIRINIHRLTRIKSTDWLQKSEIVSIKKHLPGSYVCVCVFFFYSIQFDAVVYLLDRRCFSLSIINFERIHHFFRLSKVNWTNSLGIAIGNMYTHFDDNTRFKIQDSTLYIMTAVHLSHFNQVLRRADFFVFVLLSQTQIWIGITLIGTHTHRLCNTS